MMGDVRSSIDEDAVTWFVVLRDEAATAEDRARFNVWLQADPRHRQAWQEVAGLWTGIDALRPAAGKSAPDFERGHIFTRRRSSLAGWTRVMATAAVLLVMVAGTAGFWAIQPPGFTAALFAEHRTAFGEQKVVALPDGSTVALGASSAMSVAFDGLQRRVVLHQGEGYFSAQRDPDHPFVVDAADGRITVIGTTFDVKLTGGEVAVAVTSGVVEVTSGAGTQIQLTTGQGVRYGKNDMGGLRTIDPADVGSWRSGRLVFVGVPLGEVLNDLERYRRGRIVVMGDAIAALPVTAVFDTRRPDAALDTIARTLPVKLRRLSDLLVLITPTD